MARARLLGGPTGAGVEYGITPNWLLKAEYLYVGFPSQNLTEINPAFPTFTATASNRLSASIVRVGPGLQVRSAAARPITERLRTRSGSFWRCWSQCVAGRKQCPQSETFLRQMSGGRSLLPKIR